MKEYENPTIGMVETCPFCDRVIPGKPMTNGDKIRAMSDEELAVTLMCPNDMGMSDIECDKSDDCNCAQCLYAWLKQEVKTDGSA